MIAARTIDRFAGPLRVGAAAPRSASGRRDREQFRAIRMRGRRMICRHQDDRQEMDFVYLLFSENVSL